MEDIQRVHLLSHPDELNGLVDDGADGEGCPAARVSVELGEDDTVEVETVVEGLGRIHRVLPRHGVDDEERLAGAYGLLDRLDLAHHLLVYCEATRGVDDHDIAALTHGLSDPSASDRHGILALQVIVDGDADLLRQYAQLLDRSRAVDVGCHEERLLGLLRLQQGGQLAREGRLPRAL